MCSHYINGKGIYARPLPLPFAFGLDLPLPFEGEDFCFFDGGSSSAGLETFKTMTSSFSFNAFVLRMIGTSIVAVVEQTFVEMLRVSRTALATAGSKLEFTAQYATMKGSPCLRAHPVRTSLVGYISIGFTYPVYSRSLCVKSEPILTPAHFSCVMTTLFDNATSCNAPALTALLTNTFCCGKRWIVT